MQLAKSIMLKSSASGFKIFLFALSFTSAAYVSAQTNSPYSRYGIGDMFPKSNITSRGMGGITAGFADYYSVNFGNPASYASFFAVQEKKTKKLDAGRVVFDAGINIENRTLIAPNTPKNFASSDVYFSYLQVGIPLKKNWGLSFGLRPISRIGYKITRNERLKDPLTNEYIDSAITQFTGSGGTFLPSVGTGFAIGKLSLGVNAGYLFGRKELSTRRAFINDSVNYYNSEHLNNFSFGGLFFDAGIQYLIALKPGRNIRLGASGNWKQNIDGTQDQLRQTFTLGAAGDALQIDSVFQQDDVPGQIVYPATYTGGFVYSNYKSEGRGYMFGVDYTVGQWTDYRFFGKQDSVQNSWKLAAGGQINPKPGAGYFSHVGYRFGVSIGQDNIRVENKLPLFGVSFGATLPIRTSQLARNQINAVNLSFEFIKRGNNDNLLKENLFRLSAGFNFTDLWFIKRKYE
jgi:hypothetical protein